MSGVIRAPAKPRPPSGPRAARPPTGTPQLRPAADPAQVVGLPYDPQPPQWTGSDLEWIVWDMLVRKGWKIFGRQRVPGQTSDLMAADAVYQPAITAPGLNRIKAFFRADYQILPWGRGGLPPTGYSRGILFDPVNPFTHANTGDDRLNRGILAAEGWLLIWLDDTDLHSRPREVVDLAIRGVDVSSIARNTR